MFKPSMFVLPLMWDMTDMSFSGVVGLFALGVLRFFPGPRHFSGHNFLA